MKVPKDPICVLNFLTSVIVKPTDFVPKLASSLKKMVDFFPSENGNYEKQKEIGSCQPR